MSELRGVVYCVHDKKNGTKNRALRNAAKTGMDRRETTVTFNTERARGQIRFEPIKDSASYSKPRGKTRQ